MRSSVSTDDPLHHVYHCVLFHPSRVSAIGRSDRNFVFERHRTSVGRPSAVRPNGFSRSRFVISPRFIFIGDSHTFGSSSKCPSVQLSNSVERDGAPTRRERSSRRSPCLLPERRRLLHLPRHGRREDRISRADMQVRLAHGAFPASRRSLPTPALTLPANRPTANACPAGNFRRRERAKRRHVASARRGSLTGSTRSMERLRRQ